VKEAAKYFGYIIANGLVVVVTTLIGARFYTSSSGTNALILSLAASIGVQFAITWKVIERNGSKAK
jgi:hypothetical protein